MIQDLKEFKLPQGVRGRSIWIVQLWRLVQSTLFRGSPNFSYGFRRTLLRLFGAKIGRNAIIRPTVKIDYPWNITIGDYAWIGDDVALYGFGRIEIQDNAVVSQRSYLCTVDHDYQTPQFPTRISHVVIESQAWVASDVFVGPGVTVGKASVIGARSTVLNNMPANMLCAGYPCKPIKPRLKN